MKPDCACAKKVAPILNSPLKSAIPPNFSVKRLAVKAFRGVNQDFFNGLLIKHHDAPNLERVGYD
jgi:hypothetical protein